MKSTSTHFQWILVVLPKLSELLDALSVLLFLAILSILLEQPLDAWVIEVPRYVAFDTASSILPVLTFGTSTFAVTVGLKGSNLDWTSLVWTSKLGLIVHIFLDWLNSPNLNWTSWVSTFSLIFGWLNSSNFAFVTLSELLRLFLIFELSSETSPVKEEILLDILPILSILFLSASKIFLV